MNAIPNSKLPYFAAPIGHLDRLDPIPQSGTRDEDIENESMLDILDMPVLGVWRGPFPEKTETISDAEQMPIPSSLMRRIEHELETKQYDARTVFSACRGLPRGSRRFEDAYISARLRSFAKQRRSHTVPTALKPPVAEAQLQESPLFAMQRNLPPRSHPMAVIHLGDLMNHFGIWVIGLLGLQTWAAWRIGSFANEYLEGGRNFYFSIGLFVMLMSDSCIWFRRRGNLSRTFHLPGLVLFLTAMLPIIALHLREVITALK